jgi:23S rRNA (uracil747-C5)-methyltransferase
MKQNCVYYQEGFCKICSQISNSYADQLEQKKRQIKNLLFINDLIVYPSSPWACRDKAKLQVSGTFDNPIIGFLNPESLVVETEILNCPLHNNFINQTILKLKTLITKYQISPYDVHTRKGELKGMILFQSPTTQESYVRFILRSKECLDRLKKIVSDLPEITSLSANIQPIPTQF